ncbi:MAG: GTP-binding protein [Candidatus Micrarchaeia archaeon]
MAGNIVETGIVKLDEMLGGGVRKGASVLFIGNPGVDPSIFLLHMAHHNLVHQSRCLYYTDTRFPEDVLKKTAEMKLWDKHALDRMELMDGFSAKAGLPSRRKYAVKKMDARNVAAVLDGAIKENKDNEILFIENFESALGYGEKQALDIANSVMMSSMSNQATLVVGLTDWGGDESSRFVDKMKEMFDYVIRLSSIEEKFLMRTYFFIEKSPSKFLSWVVPFRVSMEGIGVYVPKILITGPFHSGKSSFIHKVSTRAVSVDRIGTTIALDHGYIDYSGLGADLFGTPGQERFEFMLDILKKDAFGVILIIDSTDPSTFDRAKDMLQHVKREAIPYLIAANKKDIAGAMSPEEIRQKMQIPKEIPIIPTSALTGEGCLDAVKRLIDLVIEAKIGRKRSEGM